VSAHPKVDLATGEMLFFNYSTTPPFMNYGVLDADGALAHYTPIELPGARLPHDMAFTEHYAVLNDCPMFWDPDLLARDVHAVRFYRDIPTRIGVVPRRGTNADIRWFEADPTFVLHWINAYEEGDEVVLDGYFQVDPAPASPPDATIEERMFRFLDSTVLGPKPYRWRLNMVTGAVTEGFLDDRTCEFGMINGHHWGRPYRYVYAMTNKPGWFLFDGLLRTDVTTGATQEYRFGEGVFASESPMAPRVGSASEDDGYVLTYTTDMNRDVSECLVFDARAIDAGPIARVRLPERISSGTHSYWMARPEGAA
jgi:carotenoid cleavage dioxygenase-like enzyme